MNPPPAASGGLAQGFQEERPVRVGAENGGAAVPSCHDVVESAGYSKRGLRAMRLSWREGGELLRSVD